MSGKLTVFCQGAIERPGVMSAGAHDLLTAVSLSQSRGALGLKWAMPNGSGPFASFSFTALTT
jgi:hypothetical protein